MCREELYRRGREQSRVERNYTDGGGSDHVYRGTISTREGAITCREELYRRGGRDHV